MESEFASDVVIVKPGAFVNAHASGAAIEMAE
jgi:hypothetical protein